MINDRLLQRIFILRNHLSKCSYSGRTCSLNDFSSLEAISASLHADESKKRRVFLVQPVEESQSDFERKWHEKECEALIRSVPGWSVIGSLQVLTKLPPGRFSLWGAGTMKHINSVIREIGLKNLSSIVINYQRLTAGQQTQLHKYFTIDIIDRYLLILHLFKSYAKSPSAKLHTKLAELPYLRSRLFGSWDNSVPFDARYDEQKKLDKYESMLRKKLIEEEESFQQETVQRRRAATELPMIGVIGYTNAGKTSLIQLLTRNTHLQPKSQLFATLDVHSFEATLPQGLRVDLADTVGFIENLPAVLKPTFDCTLRAARNAHLLVHIIDLSLGSEVVVRQHNVVLRSLQKSGIPHELIDNIVHVANKCDTVTQNQIDETLIALKNLVENAPQHVAVVSMKTGAGIDNMCELLLQKCLATTGYFYCKLRLPVDDRLSDYIDFLSKNAQLVGYKGDVNTPDKVVVSVFFNKATADQFQKKFRIKLIRAH